MAQIICLCGTRACMVLCAYAPVSEYHDQQSLRPESVAGCLQIARKVPLAMNGVPHVHRGMTRAASRWFRLTFPTHRSELQRTPTCAACKGESNTVFNRGIVAFAPSASARSQSPVASVSHKRPAYTPAAHSDPNVASLWHGFFIYCGRLYQYQLHAQWH